MTTTTTRNAAPDEGRRQRDTTGTATSRATGFRKAQMKQAKARLALAGPAGSGKTWTSLSIAEELVAGTGERIYLIDTEPSDDHNSASELYSAEFDFAVLQWKPPYDPRDLALTIRSMKRDNPDCGCLIIDSSSHFWRGRGGTLDQADGRYTGWKGATESQDDMVDAMLRAPFHVICCMRAKQDHAQQIGKDGKIEVVKLGMAPVQRDDMDYEFQVCATLNMNHEIEIGKTRCARLAGAKFIANHQEELGTVLRDWLDGGVEVITQAEVDAIRRSVQAFCRAAKSGAVQAEFRQVYGMPAFLPADKHAEAWEWLKAKGVELVPEGPAAPPPDPEGDSGHDDAPPPPEPAGPGETSPEGSTPTDEAERMEAEGAAPVENEADAAGRVVDDPEWRAAVEEHVAGIRQTAEVAQLLALRGLAVKGSIPKLRAQLVGVLMAEGFDPRFQ